LKFRNAEDGDYECLARLGEKSGLLIEGLTAKKFEKVLHWLFRNNLHGTPIQLLAEDSGDVIGHYGAIPFWYKWRDRYIQVALASNLVIAKGVRRPLFFEIQRELSKKANSYEIPFVYAPVTRPGLLELHLAVGWKNLGLLNVYARPISFSNILKIFSNNYYFLKYFSPLAFGFQKLWDYLFPSRKIRLLEVSRIFEFDTSFISFLSEWMLTRKICSLRKIETLNWRFFGCKSRDYIIFKSTKNKFVSGYLAARLMMMKDFYVLAIVDLVVMPNDQTSFLALMEECVGYAKSQGVDLIATALTEHDENLDNFRKKGFFCTGQKFNILGKASTIKGVTMDEDFFLEWHINWFDHDYV
jgi:hypothetical protein